MERKIVILFESHPVANYVRRYDFRTLIAAGYSLEICDLADLFSFDYGRKSTIEEYPGVKIYSFKRKNEFEKYIERLQQGAFIWSTFQLTAEYYWVFKKISRYSYGFICNVDYVVPRGGSRMLKTAYWTRWSWHRLKNAFFLRIPRSLLSVRKADAVITYGADDVQRKLANVLYDEHTAVELTNTIDFNECVNALSLGETEEIEDMPEQYLLFVDEYIPYHPDGLKLGMRFDAIKYYREVETFLQRVSRFMEIPVIVAAHPKADYSLHAECYQGMRIIQFRTAELINKAKLVITHWSISISMILVCRKPYMLIVTNDLMDVAYGGTIDHVEHDLHRRALNVSKKIEDDVLHSEIDNALRVKKEYFDEQILKYRLPNGHPNESLSFGEVMIKAMKRIENSETQKI